MWCSGLWTNNIFFLYKSLFEICGDETLPTFFKFFDKIWSFPHSQHHLPEFLGIGSCHGFPLLKRTNRLELIIIIIIIIIIIYGSCLSRRPQGHALCFLLIFLTISA